MDNKHSLKFTEERTVVFHWDWLVSKEVYNQAVVILIIIAELYTISHKMNAS